MDVFYNKIASIISVSNNQVRGRISLVLRENQLWVRWGSSCMGEMEALTQCL